MGLTKAEKEKQEKAFKRKQKAFEEAKPSKVLSMALDDIKAVHDSRKYRIDMGVWHRPNGKCTVCFAGSVMANRLGAKIKLSMKPEDYPEPIADRFYFLNSIRTGEIRTALQNMGISKEDRLKVPELVHVPYYYYDDDETEERYQEWRKALKGIVKLLKEAGL